MTRGAAPGAMRATILLSLTQIIGWTTTFSAPAVLGRPMASDFGASLPVIFAAASVFLVALALASRPLAPAFPRFGARPILIVGSICTALALVALSFARSIEVYFAIWFALGCFGAMTLSTAAHTRMAELLGADAKRGVATIMLASGISNTIGFPATEALLQWVGWRDTFLVFAVIQLCVCAPAHFFTGGSGPERSDADRSAPPRTAPTLDPRQSRLYFFLMLAMALIGFVTWGLSVAFIELFRALGVGSLEALSMASAVGLFQVAARVIDLIQGRRVSALATTCACMAATPLAFVILFLGDGVWAAWLFVAVYGLASGAISVARQTLPLEMFDPRDYGYLMSRMALPSNLGYAAAAPLFVWLIESHGPRAAALLAFLLALAALGFMLVVARTARGK